MRGTCTAQFRKHIQYPLPKVSIIHYPKSQIIANHVSNLKKSLGLLLFASGHVEADILYGMLLRQELVEVFNLSSKLVAEQSLPPAVPLGVS